MFLRLAVRLAGFHVKFMNCTIHTNIYIYIYCKANRNRFRYALRGDTYRFFPAIDHAILEAATRRRIECLRTLALIDLIIDGPTRRSQSTPTSTATICSHRSSAAAACRSGI